MISAQTEFGSVGVCNLNLADKLLSDSWLGVKPTPQTPHTRKDFYAGVKVLITMLNKPRRPRKAVPAYPARLSQRAALPDRVHRSATLVMSK